MPHLTLRCSPRLLQAVRRTPASIINSFSQRRQNCTKSTPEVSLCSKNGRNNSAPTPPLSPFSRQFWTSKPVWKRAGLNTLRCLAGCTLGDFSALFYLQTHHANLGTSTTMAISMAAGISTSLLLETTLLRLGGDQLGWMLAARTAAGMSMISMLAMELAENVVDYHLTGGVVQFDSLQFWGAAGVAIAAGFLTPLPYNYLRLRKFGKACH